MPESFNTDINSLGFATDFLQILILVRKFVIGKVLSITMLASQSPVSNFIDDEAKSPKLPILLFIIGVCNNNMTELN